MSWFEALTVINTSLIAFLSIIFYRRQKLFEIKASEIMELNKKTHDITLRADKCIEHNSFIDDRDFERIAYLVSRFKKHNSKLSTLLLEYESLWDSVKTYGDTSLTKHKQDLLKISVQIRDLADDLLR